jgi:hypothetical protein
MKIINSASRIVFIMLAITACVGFFLKILSADMFMILATGAFTYYFTKPEVKNPTV